MKDRPKEVSGRGSKSLQAPKARMRESPNKPDAGELKK